MQIALNVIVMTISGEKPAKIRVNAARKTAKDVIPGLESAIAPLVGLATTAPDNVRSLCTVKAVTNVVTV